MKWELKTLNELGFVGRGKSRHRPRNAEHLYGGIYPFIQTGDIQKANFYITEYSQTYSEDGLAQSKLWNQGTMVISIVGANTAETAILGFDACFPDSVIGFVPDKLKTDVKFVKYNLEYLKSHLKSISEGTARENLSLEKLLSIKIPTPPLNTQQKISSILSAYDDLIENNLKRIKLLEEKALMEYRIIFSENELSEFPLDDVWEIKYGKNLPQTKITESGKYPVYGAAGRIGFYEEFNYEFPVALVTSRGNGSGVAHRTNQSAFVTNNSFAFVPKEEFVNVHFHLAEMILRDLELTQLRSGTAQPQLTIAGLIGVKLKLPKKESLHEFNKIVDPVFDLIFTLENQNTKLREARDILLPKLMNGQIEV